MQHFIVCGLSVFPPQLVLLLTMPNGVFLSSSSSSSSSSSLHFQLRPACGLHEYASQAALEHTQSNNYARWACKSSSTKHPFARSWRYNTWKLPWGREGCSPWVALMAIMILM
jgi:hypothetical protein